MLSQKLMKELLILNFVLDTAKKKEEINSRSETLSLCKTTHYILEKGNDSLGFLKEKIAILSKLFKAIKPNFDSIVNARTFFLENKKRNKKEFENQKLLQSMYKVWQDGYYAKIIKSN